MIRKTSKFTFIVGSILLLFIWTGCGQKDSDLGKEVLVRVGDRVVTVLDFKNAFEIAKIAYDDNIDEEPEDLREAQIRQLNQLTVELILLERAQELQVSITEAELEEAVREIKSDYPEGEFEKTLLEFAVSYESWKERLRTRLIIEKVIEEELKNRITITAEDISEYYEKNYQNREVESDPTQKTKDINEVIVKQLRRKKAEEMYSSWIEDLKKQYTIEINREKWEKIAGHKSNQENKKAVPDVSKSD